MRLYRISHVVDAGGPGEREVIRYAGTQADAAAARRAMMAERNAKFKDVDLAEIDVPTDKAGLLAWLNSHA